MIALRIFYLFLFSFCLVQQWTFLHGQQTDRLSSDNTEDSRICRQKDSCTCVRSDGTGINLHHLDTGPKPRYVTCVSNVDPNLDLYEVEGFVDISSVFCEKKVDILMGFVSLTEKVDQNFNGYKVWFGCFV